MRLLHQLRFIRKIHEDLKRTTVGRARRGVALERCYGARPRLGNVEGECAGGGGRFGTRLAAHSIMIGGIRSE